MPYPRKLLNPQEEIILDLHPHWWFFIWQAVLLVAAIVVAILLATTGNDTLTLIGILLVLAALAWFGFRYVRWTTTYFVLTTDRLISRYGIVSRRGVQIPLERVNNVNFSQTMWERLIGAGDLIIESAGEQGTQRFKDVRKPDLVTNAIHIEMESNERRKYERLAPGSVGGSTLPPPPPPQADVLAQLEKLEELRQRGVLSQEEFDEQKAKLLERM